MQKAWIKFNLEESEGRNELKRALKADDAFQALNEIWEQVFRPSFKHGFHKKELQKLAVNLEEDADGNDVIDYLADIYHKIIADYGVNPDDFGG